MPPSPSVAEPTDAATPVGATEAAGSAAAAISADAADSADDAFLRRLLAASPDCIKVLDLDGRLLSMTEAGRRALEIDDLTPHLGTCWTDWWHGPDHAAAAAAVARARAGGTGRFEAGADTAKGTPKWWDVSVTAIPATDGRPERLLAVSRDVTARRAATDAAAERLDRLRSVVASAKDYAVISVGTDGRIDGWSTGAVDTFGWSEEAAVGQPFALIWTAEDRAAGSPGRELRVAEDAGACPDNRWHVRSDGRRIFVVGATRPVRNAAGGLAGYVKVCRDETDARADAEALADARRRSDAALLAGEVGTFTWDIPADRVYGDANFDRLFGLAPDPAGSSRLADYLAAIHPADRAATSAKIDRTLAEGVAYEAEYRIVRRVADVRWVVARGRVERDPAGRPVRFPGVIVDVTDRKRAEDALRATEARYRTLFQSLDEGFCEIEMLFADGGGGGPEVGGAGTCVDYRFIEVNPAFERHTGLSAVTGRRVRELIPDLDEHWFRLYGSVAVTGEPVRYVDHAVALGRWFEVYAFRIGDPPARRVAVVFTDVTARRQADVDRERLAEQRRLALDAADLGWWHLDVASGTVTGDDRFKAVFDLPGPNWAYADLVALLHPDDRGPVDAALRAATGPDARPYAVEYRLARPDGSARWVRSRGQADHTGVGADRRSTSMVGTVEDVTAEKRAAADREHLLSAERSARAQAEASAAEAEVAGKIKDEFLATLSHELRTPLNAIVGWTQILRSAAGDPDDLAEGLAVIDRNARAQTQIIEDILDMSRIVAGKLRLDVRPVDLAGLVRAGVDTVQPAADAKGVRLRVVLDPAAGAVAGDPNRLHQVFWNLLSNAVKFTPRGGHVRVSLGAVDGHAEVTVTDTGEGIPAEFLPHVFDRFRQADASTTRRHGGLGLGLAIVKQLVELHGGSVRVASPGPGRGSTFAVALPLTVTPVPRVEPDADPREHPPAGPRANDPSACEQLAGVRVVAVDDEPDGVAMVRRLLEACGAVVRTATSAAEAFDLVTADPPDVLVSDVGMPGEDGYALIRRVRSLPPDHPASHVYAAALTAYARAADRVRALEAGFQMHLSKPVEPTELVVTVAALARRAGTDARPVVARPQIPAGPQAS